MVAVRNATITMIEDHKDLLKQIVAEAESLSKTMEYEQHAVAAQVAARRGYRRGLKSAAGSRSWTAD